MSEDFAARAKALSDRALIAAWHECGEDAGTPWSEALSAELERRELDV